MRNLIKKFINDNFLFDDSIDSLRDNMSLLDSGIIDSIGTLELIEFIQREFQIRIEDKELVRDNFDSIDKICQFLQGKGIQFDINNEDDVIDEYRDKKAIWA